jgi:uncharacterized protein (TIGR02996 family)
MAKKKVSGHDRAFLDDIAANPEDDGPRLVYADWLTDNDQPHRAEFIRLQCRLASMDELDPERLPLEQREDDFLFVYRYQWPPLPAWARMIHNAFRRGFLDRTSMTAADLLKRGPAIFDKAPITDLEIRAIRDNMPEVAACPLLARLRALRLEEASITPQNPLTVKDLRVLGKSPHLSALQALELPAVTLTTAHAKALGDWPILPQLRRLEVCPETAEAFKALAQPGRLASLERLIYRGPYPSAALAALVKVAPRLTHLELRHQGTFVPGFAALGRSLTLRSLRLTGGDADPLLESQLLAGLSSLQLDALCLRQAALAHGSRLASLRRLSLKEVFLETTEALVAVPFDVLVRLDLSDAMLGAESVRLLAASPHLATLRSLNLSDNKIGDDGAIALAESPYLTGLSSLDLAECEIGPRGAAALAASPNLANLRYLGLRYNPIGDAGVQAIASSPHLGELHTLDLDGTRAGAAGLRALAQSRGLGKLRRLYLSVRGDSPEDLAREFADPARLPSLLELHLNCDPRHTAMSALGRKIVL